MGARGGPAAFAHPEMVAMHTRMAGELGADVIKTDWPEDAAAFRRIAGGALAPILVAGGPRAASDRHVLDLVAQVMESGAAGILFGRNIFQSQDPGGLMRSIRAAIHG